eukprot:3008249-Rhodomonas_salina.1
MCIRDSPNRHHTESEREQRARGEWGGGERGKHRGTETQRHRDATASGRTYAETVGAVTSVPRFACGPRRIHVRFASGSGRVRVGVRVGLREGSRRVEGGAGSKYLSEGAHALLSLALGCQLSLLNTAQCCTAQTRAICTPFPTIAC